MMPCSNTAAEVQHDMDSRSDMPAQIVTDMTADLLGNKAVGSRFSRSITLADFVAEEPELVAEIIVRAWPRLSGEDQDLLLARVIEFIKASPDIVAGVEMDNEMEGDHE